MTRRVGGRDIVHRWEGNPLISQEDLSFRVGEIHNAGIAAMNGDVVALLNVESLEGRNLFYRACSRDGINFTVDPTPFMRPPTEGPRARYETFGIRDPRITPLDGRFYITYVADCELGLRLGLACTKDFQSVEFLGYVTQPDVKNGVLFPCKINGRYALLKRPSSGDIWLSYSDDLAFWGDEKVVMTTRGGYWDSSRIGAAAVPIEIEQGWLLIYYASKDTSAGPLVRLGAAVLDREDPSKVIARSNIPILSPREEYERIGDVPNMVFSCGARVCDGELWIYYGASGGCVCLGTAKIAEIVEFCMACAVVQDYLDGRMED
jgi:predicted GH43/DUF377 family glycosyl hydrolase